MMTKPKVLFLCACNSARSQMAEAFLRVYAGDHFEAHSAGVEPKGHIVPDVLVAMKERDLDLSNKRRLRSPKSPGFGQNLEILCSTAPIRTARRVKTRMLSYNRISLVKIMQTRGNYAEKNI
jgi:predicted protein tyrosine phosphatase